MDVTILQNPPKERKADIRKEPNGTSQFKVYPHSHRNSHRGKFYHGTRTAVFAMMNTALSLLVLSALLLGVLQAIRLGLGRRPSVR